MPTLNETIEKYNARMELHRDWYTKVTDAVLAFSGVDKMTEFRPEMMGKWVAILELLTKSPGIGQDMLNMRAAHEAVMAGQGRENDYRLAIAALIQRLKAPMVTITYAEIQSLSGMGIGIEVKADDMIISLDKQEELQPGKMH